MYSERVRAQVQYKSKHELARIMSLFIRNLSTYVKGK